MFRIITTKELRALRGDAACAAVLADKVDSLKQELADAQVTGGREEFTPYRASPAAIGAAVAKVAAQGGLPSLNKPSARAAYGAPWPLADHVTDALSGSDDTGFLPDQHVIHQALTQTVTGRNMEQLLADTALAMHIHFRRAAGCEISVGGEEFERSCLNRGVILEACGKADALVVGPERDLVATRTAEDTARRSGATLNTPCDAPTCRERLTWHVHPDGQIGACRRPGCPCDAFTDLAPWATTAPALESATDHAKAQA